MEQAQWASALRQKSQTRYNRAHVHRSNGAKSAPLYRTRQHCVPTLDYQRTHMVYQPTRLRGDFPFILIGHLL